MTVLSPAVKNQLQAMFKAFPSLLSVQWHYKGRKGKGRVYGLVFMGKDGMPLLEIENSEHIADELSRVLGDLVPAWDIGEGSKGTGVATNTVKIRLEHFVFVLETIGHVIDA